MSPTATRRRTGPTPAPGGFDAQVSYDIGDVTLEGAYRNLQTSWVGRANSSGTDGDENGYALSAVFRAREWLRFRGMFDQAERDGQWPGAGSVGALQASWRTTPSASRRASASTST